MEIKHFKNVNINFFFVLLLLHLFLLQCASGFSAEYIQKNKLKDKLRPKRSCIFNFLRNFYLTMLQILLYTIHFTFKLAK